MPDNSVTLYHSLNVDMATFMVHNLLVGWILRASRLMPHVILATVVNKIGALRQIAQ